MFTPEGRSEFDKYSEWISDDDFDLSPNFIPDDDTPPEAVAYYKRMMAPLVDFDDPSFEWPTGVGMNC